MYECIEMNRISVNRGHKIHKKSCTTLNKNNPKKKENHRDNCVNYQMNIYNLYLKGKLEY